MYRDSATSGQTTEFNLKNFPNSFYNIVNLPDSSLLSVYIAIYTDDDVNNFFILHNNKNENCFLTNENFIYAKIKTGEYPLLNFHFPFLSIKYNVIPYLYPGFIIKMFYILNKIKFSPRISDAMRSNEEQMKYKRRGWSNVESSPHLLGIAMDLSNFTRWERDEVKKLSASLGIHFLEHGGRGNHHIHLQDEEVWSDIKDFEANRLSDTLNKYIKINNTILKPYFVKTGNEKSGDDIKFYFYSDRNEIIKIEIENLFGQKRASISAGVFEPGNHTMFIHKDFLKKGTYIIKYFRNNIFYREECVFMN